VQQQAVAANTSTSSKYLQQQLERHKQQVTAAVASKWSKQQ